MRLKTLEKGLFNVVSVVTQSGEETEIEEFLSGLEHQYSSTAKGFKSLFERYARSGRRELTTALFHEADKSQGIWEFVKGSLRVYCMLDGDGNVLLLSHGIIKKGQKAKKSDIERAIALRDRYDVAKKSGALTWVEKDND